MRMHSFLLEKSLPAFGFNAIQHLSGIRYTVYGKTRCQSIRFAPKLRLNSSVCRASVPHRQFLKKPEILAFCIPLLFLQKIGGDARTTSITRRNLGGFLFFVWPWLGRCSRHGLLGVQRTSWDMMRHHGTL